MPPISLTKLLMAKDENGNSGFKLAFQGASQEVRSDFSNLLAWFKHDSLADRVFVAVMFPAIAGGIVVFDSLIGASHALSGHRRQLEFEEWAKPKRAVSPQAPKRPAP